MSLRENIEDVLINGGEKPLPMVPLSEIEKILEEFKIELDADDFTKN